MAGVTTFTQEIADSICEQIADGFSLREICAKEGMPHRATVFKWLADIKGFSDQYARAKEEQAECMADEIVAIADEANTTIKHHDGGFTEVTFDSVAVARNRLRIDARKWVASKLKPKKYGERIDVDANLNHSGSIESIKRVIVDPKANG